MQVMALALAYYTFGSKRTGLGKINVGQSGWQYLSFPTDTYAPIIPNANAGIGSIEFETWTSDTGTKIGSTTRQLILNVPSNIVPSIGSVTVSDTSKVPQYIQAGMFVSNLSKLKISTSTAGAKGSKIKTVTHKAFYNNKEVTVLGNGATLCHNRRKWLPK